MVASLAVWLQPVFFFAGTVAGVAVPVLVPAVVPVVPVVPPSVEGGAVLTGAWDVTGGAEAVVAAGAFTGFLS